MSKPLERPKVAWHLPSNAAELRWTIAVLLLPHLAALLAIAFFARGLAYTPVPVISVSASVKHHDKGIWSSQEEGPRYTLEGSFVAQAPNGLEKSSRFTTSDWLHTGFLSRRLLDREVAQLKAMREAFRSERLGETLLVRGMHPAAISVVLLVFALTAAGCESWTRLLYMGEPPSRRAKSTLRASTTPLLVWWSATPLALAAAFYLIPEPLGWYCPLWISLPILVLLDVGTVLAWYYGRLPTWTKE